MAASEAQLRANKKWHKSHTKTYAIFVNREKDADMIEHLSSMPNKQGYIKGLIRRDMIQHGIADAGRPEKK